MNHILFRLQESKRGFCYKVIYGCQMGEGVNKNGATKIISEGLAVREISERGKCVY